MSFLKNKFAIIIIVAILAGAILGTYLVEMNKSNTPNASTGTKSDVKNAGDVFKKLDELAE